MSAYRKIDYLIVGQGLAGSCLALQLVNRNKTVLVFDEPSKNRASSVAAGLFNPVTGKMMTKTWMADRIFPYLHQFYNEAERALKQRFYYPFPLYRPFVSIEEQNEWMGKSAEAGMMDYIDKVFSSSTFSNDIHDPFGGLLLKNCGYLDVPAFINAVREVLEQSNSYREELFDENDIEFTNNKIRFKEFELQKIIFCNGVGALKGEFFNTIPIRPLKGETLSVLINQSIDRIYNRGVYIVPTQSEKIFKVGATYNTKDNLERITNEGRTELIEKLNSLLKISYHELGQDWGFRPTTPDRRPILGSHPAHPNLVMFNGLGTKGVSLAPYFSNQLADWLTGVAEIERLVDLSRYS